jgi:predicted transcriptional regulator
LIHIAGGKRERHGAAIVDETLGSRIGEGMSITSIDPNVPLGMTRDIVIAEVSNNHVPPEALPGLIQQVYDTLCRIAADATARSAGMPAREAPAAPVQRRHEEASSHAAGQGEAPAIPVVDAARPRTAREEDREPAVPRDQSVSPDYIVCLFDGVKRKMLKRHIKSRYGMSPEAYRQYWELPDDYPMVAPNYSDEKREYALMTNFGVPRAKRRKGGGTRAA